MQDSETALLAVGMAACDGTGLPEVTMAEVAKHGRDGDAWIVVEGFVYDVSAFAEMHPGGRRWLVEAAGGDASDAFKLYHSPRVLAKYHDRLCVGVIKGAGPEVGAARLEAARLPGMFGDQVPYGDPAWYQRLTNSPYYKETHKRWRERVRAFTEAEILPTMHEWCEDSKPPAELVQKMGREGFLAAMMGPPYPAEYCDAPAPEDFDYFHELILYDEIARCGHAGVIAALTNGPAIGLSAIFRFGSDELKRRIMPDVLAGRKFIALAISEPNAGSDVAGLTTRATPQEGSYVVTGQKKWITNGMYADYFVTAVITGKSGMQGMSLMLIEADRDGFSRRKVNVRGSNVSGTAFLDFDGCVVPAANLIGRENHGFRQTMWNFSHERFYVSVCCLRLARVCLEESIKYAMRRKTWGKTLSEHQSIRMKIAAMVRAVEQQQCWLEFIAFQMCTMDHAEANSKIGDIVSLIKVQSSKVYELCARETTQIFGGNALYIGGVGSKIEPAVLQVKAYQIPAGAEDVMDDFAARTVFKLARKYAKL
eukprot:TRINITY_DN1002_c0_g1_i1.p1 TRINITY_DN1002_c0_g1~~TRINITY_DN1002_c0_g1_i1.p1  ORF type:complete len:549 (-),score=204.74 TRINITY_DN1002_c0_g1_i1:152-1762(-)